MVRERTPGPGRHRSAVRNVRQTTGGGLQGRRRAWDTSGVAGPEAGGDRERRLAFAIPAVEQELDGIDTGLLDPADPDQRALMIRAAHPELETDQETMVIGGREINPAAPDAPRDRRHAARRR
jgi:hypothetical protein